MLAHTTLDTYLLLPLIIFISLKIKLVDIL